MSQVTTAQQYRPEKPAAAKQANKRLSSGTMHRSHVMTGMSVQELRPDLATVVNPAGDKYKQFVIRVPKDFTKKKVCRGSPVPERVKAIAKELKDCTDAQQLSACIKMGFTYPAKWAKVREELRDQERRSVKLVQQKQAYRDVLDYEPQPCPGCAQCSKVFSWEECNDDDDTDVTTWHSTE